MLSINKKILLVICLIGIFEIAFTLRIIHLDAVPANLNPDEADTLQTYLMAKYTGSPHLFGFNWNGAPALNTYLIGWMWELFNHSILGIRMTSALLTAIGCGAFFVLVYITTQKLLLSLGISMLLATSPWFLNFSRSGWENSWNSLSLLLTLFGIHFYQKKELWKTLVFLIIGATLGFYFYHPGKLLAPTILLFLYWGCLTTSNLRAQLKLLLVFVATVTFLILPQLIFMLNPNYHGFHRISVVSILNKPNRQELILKNTLRNLRGFLIFRTNDFNVGLNASRYLPQNTSPLLPPLTLLYLWGILIALFKFRPYLFLYLLLLLPVEVLSIDTPDAARSVHLLPLIFLFIGLAVDFILDLNKRHLPQFQKFLGGTIFAVMLAISTYQWMIYWRWIQNPSTLSAREPAVAREDYSLWLQTLEDTIQNTGKGFTVGGWKEQLQKF